MNQITLTNINQLVDYTNINQYIIISYNNENANNQYFGNFSESTALQSDDATIRVLDVENVNVSHNENGNMNYIMYSSAPMRIAGSEPVPLINRRHGHTLAFDEITEHMRFDVITLDTSTILVLYEKYKKNIDKYNTNNTNNTNTETNCDVQTNCV